METKFADKLKSLRVKRGLSQQQLANQLFVDRSSIANWESGRRMPNLEMTEKLSKCLGVDIDELLDVVNAGNETLDIIVVDDEEILLKGAIPVLSEAMPDASIIGFTRVSEAIEYSKNNPVSIAFLDIEIGRNCGMELCEKLVDINPLMNIIFLTSYPDYAIKAWETPASGFMVKPILLEDVKKQLKKLRNPVKGLKIYD